MVRQNRHYSSEALEKSGRKLAKVFVLVNVELIPHHRYGGRLVFGAGNKHFVLVRGVI